MIIDMHAHTSNRVMWNLHVKSASIASLENEARRYGISLIVLMATYFPIKGTGVYNLDLLERIEGRPLFKIFGSLDVMNKLDAGIVELELLAQRALIAGIKLYSGYQGFEPSEQRLYGVYDLAGRYNLPVMLHSGELHHCCGASLREGKAKPCGFSVCKIQEYDDLCRPEYIEKPAREYPNVKFIVSHLANPHFSELRDVMKRCPNIFTDISGQFVSGSSEDTEEYRQFIVSEIRQFLLCPDGYKRVMFATDFPIQSYKASLDLISRLQLDSRQKENILALNAMRILDQNYVLGRRS